MEASLEAALASGDLSRLTTYQAGIIQASVNRTLQKVSDDALKPYGISKMQWMILGSILDAGSMGARATDLAKTLDTTLPYLTNSINYLESRGMVTRTDNKHDSRSKLAIIHPDFVPKCAEIEETLRTALREAIYVHVAPADFCTYFRVLSQLYTMR